MTISDRRTVMAGLGLALGAGGAASAAGPKMRSEAARQAAMPGSEAGLETGTERDQTDRLQALIDASSTRGIPVLLPPGRFAARLLTLKPGAKLVGSARTSTIALAPDGHLSGEGADDVVLEGFAIDGRSGAGGPAEALLSFHNCRAVRLRDLEVVASPSNGINLSGCSGRVSDCTVRLTARAGIRSLDARGLDITDNAVTDCADNGILVWRSKVGEDGTLVSGNRIERIGAASGGSGQYGNGINVYRAGGVLVTANRIADCAYTAIRGNAASDIQVVANHCTRLGEVALYAEFGFDGALIAANLVDTAASGISVTNFNEGGRLAVVQGNLIRNLFRREHEPQDKRGEGIGVEADTVVTGNTIEGAPTCGLKLGFGAYLRDVMATNNLIRNARVGILVTGSAAAGPCHISGNLISNVRDGAIRAHDHDRIEGPDLAKGGSAPGRVSIGGNVVV